MEHNVLNVCIACLKIYQINQQYQPSVISNSIDLWKEKERIKYGGFCLTATKYCIFLGHNMLYFFCDLFASYCDMDTHCMPQP